MQRLSLIYNIYIWFSDFNVSTLPRRFHLWRFTLGNQRNTGSRDRSMRSAFLRPLAQENLWTPRWVMLFSQRHGFLQPPSKEYDFFSFRWIHTGRSHWSGLYNRFFKQLRSLQNVLSSAMTLLLQISASYVSSISISKKYVKPEFVATSFGASYTNINRP